MICLVAKTDPNTLMTDIGHALMPILKDQGKVAVREIVIEANRAGVSSEDMSYIFWALATDKGLPDQGPRHKVFQVMLDIMARTGVMPNYQRAFQIPESTDTDLAVDTIALHMGMWAARTMLPALTTEYVKVLMRVAHKVPEATDGDVPVSNGVAYLNHVFREVLTLRSSMFEDGELLRRVLRIIPEW